MDSDHASSTLPENTCIRGEAEELCISQEAVLENAARAYAHLREFPKARYESRMAMSWKDPWASLLQSASKVAPGVRI